MTCIIGDPDGAFVHFAPLTTSDNSLLVLGLYPNAKADIKRVCATEHEMLDLLKFDNVDWVDFVPLSSRSTNAVIDQRIVESFADDEELVRDYCRRFAEHLSADANAMGCVYIAGGTCQAAFEKAIKMEIITREVCLSATHDISIMSIGGKRFIVLEHAPHPSWHLVMGREPKAVRIFKETMCTFNGMRCWCAAPGEAPLDECVHAALGDLADTFAARASARPFLTELLYKKSTDHFSPKHAHLRHMDAHLPKVQVLLRKWHERGPKVLQSILMSGDLYTDLVGRDAALEKWFIKLGPKAFPTFMCNGIASRIGEEAFEKVLERWFNKLGPKAFPTFMCNGIASRIGEEAFEKVLERWFNKLGPKAFPTFMCNGIASRIGEEAFEKVLERWLELLATHGDLEGSSFVSIFSRGSFVMRVAERKFEAHLVELFTKKLDCSPQKLGAFLRQHDGKKLDRI